MVEKFNLLSVSESRYKPDFAVYQLLKDQKRDNELDLKFSIILEAVEKNQLECTVAIIFKHEQIEIKDDDLVQNPILEYSVTNVFEILDERIYKKFSNSKLYQLRRRALRIVFNTSIGNTRGMFISRIQDTPFELILPLFDVEEMIEGIYSEEQE